MKPETHIRNLVVRYGAAIFLSAFLLFQVQPLLANYILPWFGGTSNVWTACLLFFQVLLVGGYAYAHFLSRFNLRTQTLVHLALLLLSLALLPITPAEGWKPTGSETPVVRILSLLSVSVGIPYLILSSTGPLLQSWFVRDSGGASPYRLFALSNAASLLGLVTYPFLVQPALDTEPQTRLWSAGYGLFVLAAAWCAVPLLRRAALPATRSGEDDPANDGRPRAKTIALWLVLPGTASLLLLGITNRVTMEVAAVPFLWVVPLVLYLSTFIVSFEKPSWYSRRVFAPLLGLALLANTMLVPVLFHPHWSHHLVIACATLFICAMVCHGELFRLRPHPSHLTAFYLTIAVGGALGGIFVAIVAPLIFPGYWEVPLGLLLCLFLFLALLHREGVFTTGPERRPRGMGWIAVGIGLVGPGLMAVPLLSMWNTDVQVRTFYGVHKLEDRDADTPRALRILRHGLTLHGSQFLSEERRRTPLAYYGAGSGIDVALRNHPRRLAGKPMRVGVVGLGAGAVAAYAREGDAYRFYELDPQVLEFARGYFTYLADCPGSVDVVIGDGRISLEREFGDDEEKYDVLAVDAFAGGSIPVHLLTRECFALYRRALKPDGVLAVHVSNKYLHLARVVRGGAAAPGWDAVRVLSDADAEAALESSQWVLVTANRSFLDSPVVRDAVTAWQAGDDPVTWTDRKSSLLHVLR